MANTYKNIVITPNIGNTADPRIQFSGGNTTVNTDINLYVYPDSNGTLSFEGSAGQLFSITNDLSNSIFSVNDISGIPSFEIFANSLISVAPFGGNVVFGNTSELILSPGTGLYANGGLGTAGQVLHSNGSSVYWGADDNTGTVTSVASGNGIIGGPITSSGTLSVLANNGIAANSTGLFVTQGTGTVVNATGVHVNDSYIATLTANNTSFVGSVSAANVVSNAQLSANLANYAALSGAVFTGAVTVSNDFTVTGNLTLSGNTLIVGANNLVVSDAIISLHTPANLAQLTSNDGRNIGLAFHYYDTEDRHALLYRDNSTGRLQFYTDGGDPQTNSNPTGNSFGVIQADSFWAGNDSVFATINSTSYTGAANSSLYANASISNTFTVGTAAYFVANGNVGIGNNTPAYKLSISGGLHLRGPNHSKLSLITDDGNGVLIRQLDNQQISFGGVSSYYAGLGLDVIWIGAADPGQATGVVLRKDAGDILAQRRTTNAQTSRIYGTFTDASNYERLSLSANATAAYIRTEAAGTGSGRSLSLGANGSNIITLEHGSKAFRVNAGGIAGYAGTGFYHLDNTAFAFGQDAGSVVWGGIYPLGFLVSSGNYYGFGSSGVSSPDTLLYRDASNTLALRNSTSAQTSRIYGTFTDGSNYERLSLSANSTAAYIQAQEAGTGIARDLYIGANNTTHMVVAANGNVGLGTTAPTSPIQIVKEGGYGVNYSFIKVNNTSTDGNPSSQIEIAHRGTPAYLRTTWYSTGSRFSIIAGDNANVEHFVIDTNGVHFPTKNVGIGNTAPDAKLAVTGTANVSGNVTIGGITTFNANVVLGSSGLSANGSFGTATHSLHSNGSATYWAADDNTTYDLAAVANTTTNQGIVRLTSSTNANDDVEFTGSNGIFVSSNASHIIITGAGSGFTNGESISVNNFVITGAFTANNSNGTSGQVLTTNGSAVYWSSASGAPIANVITNTAFTAIKDNRYFLTNAASTTVTLPPSPSLGDTVYIVVTNGLANNVVDRNGSNIMSLAENLILDISYYSIGLTYTTNNIGWAIV